MKSNTNLRAIAPIVIGLAGMAAYQIVARLQHPAVMENDLFHGMWFGICFGLEIVGLYQLRKNKRGPAA